MIKEIFISTEKHKILYGNPYEYPDTQPIDYPVHRSNSGSISQLRVNDIILCVLYSQMDDFSAAKFLLNLKLYLEARIECLDTKTIKNNFRRIVELMENVGESPFEQVESGWSNPLLQRNQYIDVVEKVHAIITPGGSVSTVIEGEIVLSQNNMVSEMELELEFEKEQALECKSSYSLKMSDDVAKIFVDKVSSGISVGSYTVFDKVIPPVEFHRVNDEYIFKSEIGMQFKELVITIPQPETAYDVKIRHSVGTSHYDREQSNVVWRMENVCFLGESILLETKTLNGEDSPEEVERPIKVDFVIPGYSHSGMKVRSCRGKEHKRENFWIHYSTQNGRYEIRHNCSNK